MAKRLIPLLDRVLVEKLQPATKTAGGILLPETAVSKMSEGKVIATGPGRRNLQNGETIPVSVTEGQTVLLPEYGGTTVKLGEKELTLYRDEELLGVLQE
ncbi:probable 10 kDa heat shock protein, mitochondrial [Coccomyxa sp. Obi]|nr:probable 10 kDa heat shock protein, mitochondrial [Coccomyxa sp. Obi]